MLVSVVIVTQNRCTDLKECLNSILRQTNQVSEILVIDNASTDNTTTMLKEEYPQITLIKMPFNSGCPGGRNIGVLNTSGEFILFLDDDCIIEQNAIETVVQRFGNEKKLGVIAMAVENYDSSGDATPYFSTKNLGNAERYFYNFSGGASLIRRNVFNTAGLFPTEYMYGGEERDLSYRILSKGFRILYCPQAKMYHKSSPLMRKKFERLKTAIFNEISIYIKYYSFNQAIISIIWKLFYFCFFSIKTNCFWYYITILFQVPWHILRAIKNKKNPVGNHIIKLEQFLKNNVVRNFNDIKIC